MSHNRNITLGDSYRYESEPKFIVYPSGKVIINFGKHKAKNIKDVDTGYLNWMLRDVDLEANVSRVIHKVINSRTTTC